MGFNRFFVVPFAAAMTSNISMHMYEYEYICACDEWINNMLIYMPIHIWPQLKCTVFPFVDDLSLVYAIYRRYGLCSCSFSLSKWLFFYHIWIWINSLHYTEHYENALDACDSVLCAGVFLWFFSILKISKKRYIVLSYMTINRERADAWTAYKNVHAWIRW